MKDDSTLEDFGSSENLLKHLQERSDDIEYVTIPQSPYIERRKDGVTLGKSVVGMLVHFVGGDKWELSPHDAEILLNDGILKRMKIRIRITNPMEGDRPAT